MPKSKRRSEKNKSVALETQEPSLLITEPMVQGDTLVLEPAPALESAAVLEPAPVLAPLPVIREVTPARVAPLSPTLRSISNLLTLEVALYVALALAALTLRLTTLDLHALSPAEAQNAAAAWEFLNGRTVGQFTSPFVFTLHWLSFFLFGANDLGVRVLPAALGALIVFVPTLARGALGKTGAVIAAVLLAFSPSLVFFARNASGVDVAVGAAVSALILLWNYSQNGRTRHLYLGSFLAAIALTCDATAFPVLLAGGLYLSITWGLARQKQADEQSNDESEWTLSAEALQNPILRAGLVFAATYILTATTFLLNRDGLGVAFNLLGTWLTGFSSFGEFVSPLNWLVVYEPLALIFGLAGLVLTLTLRVGDVKDVQILRLLGIVSLFAFISYSLAGVKTPEVLVAVSLPMTLLAGWFIGNLLERAGDDIRVTGGWRTTLAGELPILVMLMVLAALSYVEFATFLQQTRFTSAFDAIYRLLSGNVGEASMTFAAITLALITVLLLGVFIGLSVLLVGVARTTSLVAVFVLVLLTLGMLRATWLLNFTATEPLRELAAPSQTPMQIRYLVQDLEFNSQWQYGDPHVIRVIADTDLGAVGRWYLRDFNNLVWSNDIANAVDAQAVITNADSPPPGNWRGQRYRVGVDWEPTNFTGIDLWKWFVFRQGGSETYQTTMLWLPTDLQQ